MAVQIQFRRGNTAQHSVFTGVVGEVTVDTDRDILVVHDGSTVGGFPLAPIFTYDLANASYNQANTATTVATASFGKANDTYAIAVAAFDTANNSSIGIAAFDQANIATTIASAAFDTANNSSIGIAAFVQANVATLIASTAYNQANSANVLAYNTGIGANAFTSATIAGANTAVGAGANAYANLVWSRSNSFTSATIAGANTAVGGGANAFTSATIAGANTAVGGGANAYANLVWSRANVSMNLDSVNTTRYIVFDDAITGTMNRANVSYGLTFNPSTNTVSTINLNASGNVGIGRTSTSYTLDVVGTVNASALLVNGAAVGGFSSTDDTSTNATYYPLVATAAGGSTVKTSNTKLYFNPSTGTLSATIFNSLSDISHKKDINTIENALDKVYNMRGVSFTWKDNNKKSIGVVAQEIEQITPELVIETNNIKSVNYDGLIGILIESIKELKEKIEKLEENG